MRFIILLIHKFI